MGLFGINGDYPKMDGFYGKILLKWMMTRGIPILGNLQMGQDGANIGEQISRQEWLCRVSTEFFSKMTEDGICPKRADGREFLQFGETSGGVTFGGFSMIFPAW